MTKLKLAMAAGIAAALAFGVAACGNSAKEGEAAPAEAADTATPASEETAAPPAGEAMDDAAAATTTEGTMEEKK